MRGFFKAAVMAALFAATFVLILPWLSPRFRGWLDGLITPVLPDLSRKLYSDSEIENENNRLRKELAELKAHQDYLLSLYNENEKMRRLLKLEGGGKISFVHASLLARHPVAGKYEFTIDKGSRDGLRTGMPVLVGNAVYARLREVGEKSAVAGTLARKGINLGCTIKGTSYSGILQGEFAEPERGKLLCKLNFLPRDVDITPGMKVVTSGLGSENHTSLKGESLIPHSLKVGTITEVKRDELHQTAHVLIDADWLDFRYVTVLVEENEAEP